MGEGSLDKSERYPSCLSAGGLGGRRPPPIVRCDGRPQSSAAMSPVNLRANLNFEPKSHSLLTLRVAEKPSQWLKNPLD